MFLGEKKNRTSKAALLNLSFSRAACLPFAIILLCGRVETNSINPVSQGKVTGQKPCIHAGLSRFDGYSHSVLNISSPIKMSVVGILYGGYSFRYQSDFARKTFLCTRRVPQNQVSHSYQYLLATEEQPCFSIGYMNIILQKAQKSIVCCLSGAVPFGSAPLFLFQGGNNHVRVSIRIKTNRGLPTLPDLPAIYRAADEG
jgi:hypothetical protein